MKQGNGIKTFRYQLRHDIVCGALRQWKRTLPFAGIFAVFCLFFVSHCGNEQILGTVQESPVTADFALYLFRGMHPYDPSSRLPFQPSFPWLIMQLFVAFYTGSYAYDDTGVYGQQYLLRSMKKSWWFLGKCVCCLADVLICYAVVWGVIFVFSAAFGGLSFQLSEDIGRYVSGIDTTMLPLQDFLFYLVVMPMLTSWVLSMTQMLLSLYIRPAAAMVCALAYAVASAYKTSCYLLGNYSMLLRNSAFSFGGIQTEKGVLPELALAAGIILLGCVLQQRFDYIGRN